MTRKWLIMISVLLAAALCLSACGQQEKPAETAPAATAVPEKTEAPATAEPEPTEAPTRPVPSVTGMELSEAVEKLNGMGMEYDLLFVSSEDVAEYTVAAQKPDAETPVREEEKVTLIVSSGPEKISMPDVLTMNADEAIDLLTKKGLAVSSQIEMSDAEAFTVLRQDPAPDTTVTRGVQVTLVVSRGKTTIPELNGKTLEEAETLLAENHLNLQLPLRFRNIRDEETPDPDSHGTVKSANPEAGLEVIEKTYVELTVYQDPEQAISVPVTYTAPESEATALIRITMQASGSDTEVYRNTFEIAPDAADRTIEDTLVLPDGRTYYAYVYVNGVMTETAELVPPETGELSLNPAEETAEEAVTVTEAGDGSEPEGTESGTEKPEGEPEETETEVADSEGEPATQENTQDNPESEPAEQLAE